MDSGIALVTGAGSGIGSAVSRALLDAGYRVALVGRRAEPLLALAADYGEAATALPADVSDPAAVDVVFAELARRFGRLDLLINNAGRSAPAARLDDVDLADWDATLRVNIDGAFLCARRAFGMMRTQRPRGGRIINNGSISAHVPRPGNAAYTVSKHAITGLTKQLALDGRGFDIACGQIDIGNAATSMTAAAADGLPQPDGSRRPEPTFDPAHAAAAVLFMASLPLDTNVQYLTIAATEMPWIGRG